MASVIAATGFQDLASNTHVLAGAGNYNIVLANIFVEFLQTAAGFDCTLTLRSAGVNFARFPMFTNVAGLVAMNLPLTLAIPNGGVLLPTNQNIDVTSLFTGAGPNNISYTVNLYADILP